MVESNAIPTDDEIAARLVEIISDGFNRSLGALEAAGAVNAKVLHRQYRGNGDPYYELVTEQIFLTAKAGAVAVRELFRDVAERPDSTSASDQ